MQQLSASVILTATDDFPCHRVWQKIRRALREIENEEREDAGILKIRAVIVAPHLSPRNLEAIDD